MCCKKQHIKIGDIKEMPDLICGKTAVGGNYNSAHDIIGIVRNTIHYCISKGIFTIDNLVIPFFFTELRAKIVDDLLWHL